jgi:hypothetical protein
MKNKMLREIRGAKINPKSSKIRVRKIREGRNYASKYGSIIHCHHHAKLKCHMKLSRIFQFLSSFSIDCSEEKGQILNDYYRI